MSEQDYNDITLLLDDIIHQLKTVQKVLFKYDKS